MATIIEQTDLKTIYSVGATPEDSFPVGFIHPGFAADLNVTVADERTYAFDLVGDTVVLAAPVASVTVSISLSVRVERIGLIPTTGRVDLAAVNVELDRIYSILRQGGEGVQSPGAVVTTDVVREIAPGDGWAETLTWLNARRINSDASVTLSLLAGEHDVTAADQLFINHPDGARISIIGAGRDETILNVRRNNTARIFGVHVQSDLRMINGLTVRGDGWISQGQWRIDGTGNGTFCFGIGTFGGCGKVYIGPDVRVEQTYQGVLAQYPGTIFVAPGAIVRRSGDANLLARDGGVIIANGVYLSEPGDTTGGENLGHQAIAEAGFCDVSGSFMWLNPENGGALAVQRGGVLVAYEAAIGWSAAGVPATGGGNAFRALNGSMVLNGTVVRDVRKLCEAVNNSWVEWGGGALVDQRAGYGAPIDIRDGSLFKVGLYRSYLGTAETTGGDPRPSRIFRTAAVASEDFNDLFVEATSGHNVFKFGEVNLTRPANLTLFGAALTPALDMRFEVNVATEAPDLAGRLSLDGAEPRIDMTTAGAALNAERVGWKALDGQLILEKRDATDQSIVPLASVSFNATGGLGHYWRVQGDEVAALDANQLLLRRPLMLIGEDARLFFTDTAQPTTHNQVHVKHDGGQFIVEMRSDDGATIVPMFSIEVDATGASRLFFSLAGTLAAQIAEAGTGLTDFREVVTFEKMTTWIAGNLPAAANVLTLDDTQTVTGYKTIDNDVNLTGELRVGGVRVVGAQQPAVLDVAPGDADSLFRDRFNALLAALRAHGIIAT